MKEKIKIILITLLWGFLFIFLVVGNKELKESVSFNNKDIELNESGDISNTEDYKNIEKEYVTDIQKEFSNLEEYEYLDRTLCTFFSYLNEKDFDSAFSMLDIKGYTVDDLKESYAFDCDKNVVINSYTKKDHVFNVNIKILDFIGYESTEGIWHKKQRITDCKFVINSNSKVIYLPKINKGE